jgi:hypothetical protein
MRKIQAFLSGKDGSMHRLVADIAPQRGFVGVSSVKSWWDGLSAETAVPPFKSLPYSNSISAWPLLTASPGEVMMALTVPAV